MTENLEHEIQRNLFAFLPKLKTLLPEHEGSFAVLHNEEIVGIYEKLSEALRDAQSRFEDGLFSIQRVTDKPIELGMFSSADHQG
jgi:hypothetical protein